MAASLLSPLLPLETQLFLCTQQSQTLTSSPNVPAFFSAASSSSPISLSLCMCVCDEMTQQETNCVCWIPAFRRVLSKAACPHPPPCPCGKVSLQRCSGSPGGAQGGCWRCQCSSTDALALPNSSRLKGGRCQGLSVLPRPSSLSPGLVIRGFGAGSCVGEVLESWFQASWWMCSCAPGLGYGGVGGVQG